MAEKIVLGALLAPVIIGVWCFLFYLIDDMFFNGLLVGKVKKWSWKKFKEPDDDSE